MYKVLDWIRDNVLQLAVALVIIIAFVLCPLPIWQTRHTHVRYVHVQYDQKKPTHFEATDLTHSKEGVTYIWTKDYGKLTIKGDCIIFEGNTCPVCGECMN